MNGGAGLLIELCWSRLDIGPTRSIISRGTEADGAMEVDALRGRSVTIHGIMSRPNLNGLKGLVVSIDHDSGRAGVKLAGKGELVSLRFANLHKHAEQAATPKVLLDVSDDAALLPEAADRAARAEPLPVPPPCRCLLDDRPERPLPPLPPLPTTAMLSGEADTRRCVE